MNVILKDIPNYENLYAATEDGRIWSYRKKKFMKICDGNNGYKQVNLIDKLGNMKTAYLHRLIALTYLPNPENLSDINHIDENKSNNTLSNLEWTTHQTNIQHSSYRHCKKVYCVELDKVFDSIQEAAEVINVHQSNITSCCKGRLKTVSGYHWKYVEENNE